MFREKRISYNVLLVKCIHKIVKLLKGSARIEEKKSFILTCLHELSPIFDLISTVSVICGINQMHIVSGMEHMPSANAH